MTPATTTVDMRQPGTHERLMAGTEFLNTISPLFSNPQQTGQTPTQKPVGGMSIGGVGGSRGLL